VRKVAKDRVYKGEVSMRSHPEQIIFSSAVVILASS